VTRTRRVSAIGALAAAALLLGGCSDGDGDVATGSTTSTTAIVATPTSSASVGTGGRCADQNFTPNSEDIASAIVATGLSCAEAEAFVRRVGPLVGATGGPAGIEVGGFACARTGQDDGAYGIPSADYECTDGARTVTFHRT
jgi:hypothetical protein